MKKKYEITITEVEEKKGEIPSWKINLTILVCLAATLFFLWVIVEAFNM